MRAPCPAEVLSRALLGLLIERAIGQSTDASAKREAGEIGQATALLFARSTRFRYRLIVVAGDIRIEICEARRPTTSTIGGDAKQSHSYRLAKFTDQPSKPVGSLSLTGLSGQCRCIGGYWLVL